MNEFRQLGDLELKSTAGGVDLGTPLGNFIRCFFIRLGDWFNDHSPEPDPE